MSNYKYPTPQLLFTAICDKIRDKTNSNELINHQDIPDKIDNLVDSDIINEYNELLPFIIGSNSTKINTDKIENLRIKFMGNRNLATIDLPECTSIRDFAFDSCTNLATVNLPKCTSIDYAAFSGCNSLTTINLPKCTSIGEYAFKDCTTLATIDLPECTSIRFSAFSNCTNLTTIDLPKCTSIGMYAFDHCKSLTTIDLLECTSIGNYAFNYCTKLTTIDLPKCTSIENGVFNNCVGLTTVNLPKCTSIGEHAFNYCTKLTTVILSNNQRVTLKNISAFNVSPISRGAGCIYVPDNLVFSYKTATNWSTYVNQIKPLSELPSELKEEYGYD